jgi:hypothetical protein
MCRIQEKAIISKNLRVFDFIFHMIQEHCTTQKDHGVYRGKSTTFLIGKPADILSIGDIVVQFLEMSA